MDTQSDILELKLEGNGINPSIVKPSEIAGLIEQFEKVLLSTIKAEHPQIDTSAVLFNFENVKHESIGISFGFSNLSVPKELKGLVIGSYLSITTAIQNNNFSNLPNDSIIALKGIAKFSKKYNCSANFKYNGEKLSTIGPNAEIKENKQNLLKGAVTVYGELIDVGGENPNIHVRINEDYVIIIDTDKQVAKELGQRLFDTIGLKGYAKWDAATSRITEFKLESIVDYHSGNVLQSFAELKNITSGAWDNFNTNDDINKQLLRD